MNRHELDSTENTALAGRNNALVMSDVSGLMTKNLPNVFTILIADESVYMCDQENLKMNISNLRQVTSYLLSMGYSCLEFRDHRTCETGFKFSKA